MARVTQQMQDDFDEFLTEIDWLLEDLGELLRNSERYREVAVVFDGDTLDAIEAFYLDVLAGNEAVAVSSPRLDRIIIAYIGEAVRDRAGGVWVLNETKSDDAFGTPCILGWAKGDHMRLSPVEIREGLKANRKPCLREIVEYCATKDQFEEDFFKEFE